MTKEPDDAARLRQALQDRHLAPAAKGLEQACGSSTVEKTPDGAQFSKPPATPQLSQDARNAARVTTQHQLGREPEPAAQPSLKDKLQNAPKVAPEQTRWAQDSRTRESQRTPQKTAQKEADKDEF